MKLIPEVTSWCLHRGSLLLVAGCALVVGCSRGSAGTASARVEAPVPVRIAAAARKTVPVELKTFGAVETCARVDVKAQVTGELTDIHLTDGQEVKEGDLLFTLDARPFEAALKQAEANLAQGKTVAANAVAEEQRAANLLTENVFTKEQYDNAHASAVALAAAVEADLAAVDNAKTQLAYCTIRSPVNGRAGSIVIDKGNIVKANDTVPLVVINQIKPIHVSFALPEQQLPVIRRYMATERTQVEALIPNDTGAPLMGVLSFVDNAVDTATGMIRLKALFDNDDERLWPGLFVNVVITLANEPDAIVVPVDAVQDGQQGQYVFIVRDDGTAELRPVVVRRTVDSEAVIERGVQPGDWVVTDGQFRLVNGSKVELVTAGASGGGSASSGPPGPAGKDLPQNGGPGGVRNATPAGGAAHP